MKKADTQGRVISLFLKTEKGLPLSKSRDGKLLLRARFGIDGDANAGGVGPRQVLLVALEILNESKLQPGDLRCVMSKRSPSNAYTNVAVISSTGGSSSEYTTRHRLGVGRDGTFCSVRRIVMMCPLKVK